MGTLFMIIAVLLLFLGLPASIVLTIIAFAKKINSIFKFSIPIVIGGIVFFLVLGVILLPDTEVENQETVKIEQQETDNKENDKKPKEEPKVEKEESSTKKEQEKPKEEKPKENSNKKEETKTETKKTNKTQTETKENKKKEQKPKTELTEKEYKKACKKYKYKDVLRNPEKYIGKKIVITVQINTVKEEGFLNPTKYYFAYSEGDYGLFYEDYYAIFDKRKDTEDPKLLSEDIIKVWGEISEPQETTSLIVNSEEVFCIDMKYVELIEE